MAWKAVFGGAIVTREIGDVCTEGKILFSSIFILHNKLDSYQNSTYIPYKWQIYSSIDLAGE